MVGPILWCLGLACAMIAFGWFKLNGWFWAEKTQQLLGLTPAPSFFAQALAVSALAIGLVFLVPSFEKAWTALAKENTFIGRTGSFLVLFLPLLSGLFLIAGPVFENTTEMRTLYVQYAAMLYGGALLAIILVVNDDQVERGNLWRFAATWAWHKTSIMVMPYVIVGYIVSPLAWLGYLAIGTVATFVASILIIAGYKSAQSSVSSKKP